MWKAALTLTALIVAVSGYYSQVCQFSQSVSTSMTLQSPLYPSLRPFFSCRYTRIQYSSPAGTTMTITCPQFDIECPFYYRYYYYFYYTDYPFLWTSIDSRRRCGGSFPALTTTSNSLTIYFYSRFSRYFTRPRFQFNCNIQVNGATTTTTTTTTTPVADICTCGTRSPTIPIRTNRIVNGEDAVEGEYPYMVSILDSQGHTCGGSLLNNRWIITAAHCEVNVGQNVVLGQHQQSVNSANQITATIDTVINHPAYNALSNENDVTVARLGADVTFTDFIQPICLPDPFTTNTFDGVDLTASGWGATSEFGPAADILQTVNLNVITNADCAGRGGIYTGRIFDSSICALTNGQDTCTGDSGGPLATFSGGRFYLIGATSFGEGCARNERPGVYVRISNPAILSWVKTNSGITCTAPSP